jgi:hypothetical protein
MDECSDPLDVILILGKCHGCVRGLFILARINRSRVTRLSFLFMVCGGAHHPIVSATVKLFVHFTPNRATEHAMYGIPPVSCSRTLNYIIRIVHY